MGHDEGVVEGSRHSGLDSERSRRFNWATTKESWKARTRLMRCRHRPCFNWATTKESWKGRPAAKESIPSTHPAASIGPRRRSRGRRLLMMTYMPVVTSFNWATTKESWKADELIVVTSPQDEASIGPRRRSRGRHGPPDLLMRIPVASIGPRRRSRGRPPTPPPTPTPVPRSQLGHDEGVVEGTFDAIPTGRPLWLQLGHDARVVEGQIYPAYQSRKAPASIGPRRRSRGRRPEQGGGNSGEASFNWATTKESWKAASTLRVRSR